MHSRARLKSMRLRNPADERLQNTQAPEAFILFSDFFSYIVPLFLHKRAAEIAQKRSPDAAQKQKGHSYTFIHIHIHKSAAEIIVVAVPR